MDMNPDRSFSIAEISEKLKVPKHTLRFWEREFGAAFVPLRTPGTAALHDGTCDRDRYDQDLRERGLSLSEIKRSLKEETGEGHPHTKKIDLLANRWPKW